MEFAELIVKITAEGLDAVTHQLEAFATETTAAGNSIDITGDKTKAYATKLNELLSVINTFNRANKLMEGEKVRAAKEAQAKMDQIHAEAIAEERQRQAQLKLIYTAKELLYKMDAAALARAEAEKRQAMEATHAEAVAINNKMISEAQKNAAAQQRMAAHPFTAGIGRMMGFVDRGASIQAQAKQVDAFRTRAFDFLVFMGTAKMVEAIIVSSVIEPLKKAIGTAVEFERQWAIVTRTVTGSAEEMKAVRGGLQDLMATRPFDPQQITDAARALGELGVESKEIVKATDYITRFSIASDIATDEAATLIGQILATGGAVRPSAQAIGEMASAALAMGTSFAIGNKGVLTTMLRVSALIPTFHLSTEAALGLSTAMGSLGIKAERGTSALQLLLSKANSADGTKLDRFANIIGKTAEATQVLIRTDPGKFIELFVHGLNEMAQSGVNTDKMLENMGIKTVRARQAFGQMAGGADTVSAALDKAGETYGSLDDLMEQSQRQFDTTDASIKTLGNSIWALTASMTEGLLRPLNDTVNGLTNLSEAARKMPGPGFWSTLFGGTLGAGPSGGVDDINFAIDQLRKMQLAAEREASGGLMGQSPLVDSERVKTETQKAVEYVSDGIDKATQYWDDAPSPFLGPKGMEEARIQEIEGAAAKVKQARTELENFIKSADKASRSPQEVYADTLKKLEEGKQAQIPGDYDRMAADAKQTLNDALERQAKAESKLSDAQKAYNKLMQEGRTPQEEFADRMKEITDAMAGGLPETRAAVLVQDAYNKLIKDSAPAHDKAAEALKKHADEVHKYAVSLNPVVELEEKIAQVREAMAKEPGIATKAVGEEEITRLIRDVKLPEEWEKQMRIVQGITERGMNAVADTMTDALWDGATKGKEIMRNFAKDITNILLEELAFKPLSEGIIDMFKNDAVKKYMASIKEGMPGQTTPGTESAEELTQAAHATTKSFEDLGKGSLQLLLDLTQGIGGFLAGLVGGSGGGGFDWKELLLRAGIGGATAGGAKYLSGLIPSTQTNEFDQTFTGPGAGDLPGYTTGSYPSRAGLMQYSANDVHTAVRGQAPPVNVTVTALDPRTAASVIMSNMPVIERGMQRAVDRGSAYAKAHGRRR